MSRRRRLLGVPLGVLVLAAGGWVGVGPGRRRPPGGNHHPGGPNGPAVRIHPWAPPTPAEPPARTPPFADPASCADAPGHVCDLIPIHLGEPSDLEEYIVRIKVTFKTQPLANGVLGSNDIDIYLWNDPPRDRMEDPDEEDPDPNARRGPALGGDVGHRERGDRQRPRPQVLVARVPRLRHRRRQLQRRGCGTSAGAGPGPTSPLDPDFVPDLSGGSTTPAPPATPPAAARAGVRRRPRRRARCRRVRPRRPLRRPLRPPAVGPRPGPAERAAATRSRHERPAPSPPPTPCRAQRSPCG